MLQMEHVILSLEVDEKVKNHGIGQGGVVRIECSAEGKHSVGPWCTQHGEQEWEELEKKWKQTW